MFRLGKKFLSRDPPFRIARTCYGYVAGSMPLAFMQEDFLVSKGSDNIGKTLLVKMDIDTGDSPLIATKPYTLSLKHYDWVQKEISTLERAGIITKSI